MSNTLFIPIQVRQLYLDKATPVASPSTDFSGAPYYDPKTNLIVNNDNPFISENMVNEPFEDSLHDLEKGNHLHFVFPAPFTHFAEKGNRNLPVPNRWLISNDTDDWIIESDYLSEDQIPGQNSITTLLPVPDAEKKGFNVYTSKYNKKTYTKPFLYMGRQRNMYKEYVDPPTSTYWKDIYGAPLTAFAFGDAQFPVSYPNCRSVFGFHDEEGKNKDTYRLLAWFDYSKEDLKDINQQILKGIKDVLNKVRADKSISEGKSKTDAFFRELKNIGWSFTQKEFTESGVKTTLDTIEAKLDSIDQIIFYSASCGLQDAPPIEPKEVSLALGNNGVEALSAYLAGDTHKDDPQKKNELEDKLEAIQFDFLKSMQVDLGAKFEEARHLKGFKAEKSGMIWNYRIVSTNGKKELSADQLAIIKELETHNDHLFDLAEELHTLNNLQTEYDHAVSTIHDKQQDLFSDWYKYMLCAHPPMGQQEIYPPADEALNYILKTKIESDLQTLMIDTGKLDIIPLTTENARSPKFRIFTNEGYLIVSTSDYLKKSTKKSELEWNTPQKTHSKANQVLAQLKIVKDKTTDFLADLSKIDKTLTLYIYQKPAARYYAPADPSILIAGDKIVPKMINTEIKLPSCHIGTTSMFEIGSKTKWLKELKKVEQQAVKWHPVMMEWEAAFYPIESTQDQTYTQEYLSDIYDLPAGQPDFETKKGADLPQSSSSISVYRGFSHLTLYALNYLDKKLEPYKTKGNPLYDEDLANAANKLENTAVLTQALGGFNKAFIMRKQSLQLASIVDPVAMDDYKPLIQVINRFVDGNIGMAPLPNNDFNPIRGGGLNITQLNLIDSFGQKLTIYDYFKDQGKTKIHVPQTLSTDAPIQWKGYTQSVQAFLPPRFIEETRLHARWLSKDAEAIECGNHYKHSPICGWVVRNVMDDTMVLYDFKGNMLGSFGLVRGSDSNYKVQPIPKPNAMTFVPDTEITNAHLKNFANFLLKLDEKGFNDYFQLLTNAQEYTDPESFAQHPDLALLMGQPMALIRMRLNFERRGDYAYDEGWSAFENSLAGKSPLTDNYEQVQIPMRLGDYRQLNDGVVGYWDDGDNKSIDENSTFYSPVKDFYTSGHYTGTAPATAVETEFYQSLIDKEQYFTLLFDPRGKLNITSGVLPVKTINIPPYLYQDSLKNIKVAFQMAPIVTPKDKVQLPVPKEKGYQWNWVYPDVRTVATIKKTVLNREWKKLYPDTTDIYETLTQPKIILQAEPIADIEYRPILEPIPIESAMAIVDFDLLNAQNLYVLFPDSVNDAGTGKNAKNATEELLGIVKKCSDRMPLRLAIHKDILNAAWKKLYPRSRDIYSRLVKANRNYHPVLELDPRDANIAFIHFYFVNPKNLQAIFTTTKDQAKTVTKQLLKVLQEYGSNMAAFPAQATIQKTTLNKEWKKLYPNFGELYSKLIKNVSVDILGKTQTTTIEYQPILKPLRPGSEQAYIKYDLLTLENMIPIFNTITDQSKKPVEQLMQLLLKFHQGVDTVITDPQFESAEIREGWLELIEDPIK